MRVVVDASIVAAALVRPRGWTARELSRSDVEWFAPETLFDEINEHAARLSETAGCSRDSLLYRMGRLRVGLVPQAELLSALGDPLVTRAAQVDPDDVAYLAAVVATSAEYLWTRDHRLLAAFPGLAVLIVPGPADTA
jgi:predicted nucleic acid-binding protein